MDLVHWDYWGVIADNEWLELSILKSQVLKSRCLCDEFLLQDMMPSAFLGSSLSLR